MNTNGKLDIAFDSNRRYYGNGKKQPNNHSVWRSDTILPGWYDNDKAYREVLKRSIEQKKLAKRPLFDQGEVDRFVRAVEGAKNV